MGDSDREILAVAVAVEVVSAVEALAAVPEEDVWLASQKSPQSRRAYRRDVEHFVRTLGIRSADELRRVDHKAVFAWRAYKGGLRPEPPGQDLAAEPHLLQLLRPCRVELPARQGLSPSPRIEMSTSHRIELQDYSACAGLGCRASVEPDEPVSRHPALRVGTAAVGKTAPLARLVRPGLPGDAVRLYGVSVTCEVT